MLLCFHSRFNQCSNRGGGTTLRQTCTQGKNSAALEIPSVACLNGYAKDILEVKHFVDGKKKDQNADEVVLSVLHKKEKWFQKLQHAFPNIADNYVYDSKYLNCVHTGEGNKKWIFYSISFCVCR